MRAVSDQSDRAYRHHASDKQMIWLAMAPSSPGGRSYRNPDHSLVDDMPPASTVVCFDKAVIIKPGHHHRGDTRGCNGLWGGALCRLRGSLPQRDELSIGEESPPMGNQNKNRGAEAPRRRSRGSVHVLISAAE